jgi:hypothetical protein
MDELKR